MHPKCCTRSKVRKQKIGHFPSKPEKFRPQTIHCRKPVLDRGGSLITNYNSYHEPNRGQARSKMKLGATSCSFLLLHTTQINQICCSAFFTRFPSGQASPTTQTLLATAGNNDDKQLFTHVTKSEESEPERIAGTWNPLSLAVLKLGFTEPAFTSPLNYNKSPGTYLCANCRSPLFSSGAKYDSGSGWPSFWKTIAPNRVTLKREWDGRIECSCAECGGHLGHVFPDGPARGTLDARELQTVPETDPRIGYKVQAEMGEGEESKYSKMPRFCINGVALRFEKEGGNQIDFRVGSS